MKVLHVSQPTDAGVATVVETLVVDEVERGHTVSLASPRGQLSGRAVANGAEWHQWDAVRAPGLFSAQEAIRLADIVADSRPDVAVLHSSKAGLAGRLAIRGKIPTVFVPHAWSFQAVGGATRLLAESWERFAARWTHHLVCMCDDELARGRRRRIRGRSVVIRNGVDLDRFTPRDPHTARCELGLAEGPTVVCVGRLAHQKGQDVLLRAWPEVLRRVPEANLVVVGDGPERENLLRATPHRVEFVGARADTHNWFAAADVVAVPSRWETMSLVALEAMASGRPVVASAFDGAVDCLGGSGEVVPIDDHIALADALVGYLTCPPAGLAAEGAKARELATRTGDYRQSTERWNDLLRGLAG